METYSNITNIKTGDLFYAYQYSYVHNRELCWFMYDVDADNYIINNINENNKLNTTEPVMYLQQALVRKASDAGKACYTNIETVKILYKNQIKYLPINYTEVYTGYYNPNCRLQIDIIKNSGL